MKRRYVVVVAVIILLMNFVSCGGSSANKADGDLDSSVVLVGDFIDAQSNAYQSVMDIEREACQETINSLRTQLNELRSENDSLLSAIDSLRAG